MTKPNQASPQPSPNASPGTERQRRRRRRKRDVDLATAREAFEGPPEELPEELRLKG